MARPELRVLRCRDCGDTFTLHTETPEICPSCGGTELDPAWEPLL